MPTGVFDASLITQRSRAKAESNSFINRIQNPTNPTTSYGPLTGIYDNSEVNRVTNGQMKYFRRNGACTVAYIGCPCTIITPSGQVANNVVVIPPGAVQGLSVVYGSIIVNWSAPSEGTGPFTYEIRATTPGGPNVTINPATAPYTFNYPTLAEGALYTFDVRAINVLGTGPAPTTLPTIYGTYMAPTITTSVISSLSSTGATIDIGTYSLANGQFNITNAVVVGGNTTPSYQSSTSTTVVIGNLTPGTNSNYTMYLTGGTGKRSDTSLSFSIKTLSVAPVVLQPVTVISLQATCELATYTGFSAPITVVRAFNTAGSPPYPEFNVIYTAGNSSFIISVPNYDTQYTVRISISNGTFTSELSSQFTFTTPPPPEPSIQNLNLNTISWTNVTLTFDPYSFNDFSIPTGATVTKANPPSSLQVTNVTNATVEIIILDPGTSYTDYKLVLTGSGGLTSPPASIPGFNTNSANPFTPPPVNSSSVTTNSITYSIGIGGYSEQFVASYVTANTPSNQTQILTSNYTPDYNSGIATVVVSGLTSGTTYENVKLALTDNALYFTNFAQPGNFTTYYQSPQNVNVPNSGINLTSVIVEFDLYPYFTPNATNTSVSDGNESLQISAANDTSVSLINLFPKRVYTGFYLNLVSLAGQSAQLALIPNFQPTYPSPSITGITPEETQVYIDYLPYTGFTPTVQFSTVNNLSPLTGYTISSVSDTQMFITNLQSGTAYTCTITLSDGSESSLPSALISFTTTSPPPPPEPAPTSIITSPSEFQVTIGYQPYSFNDSSTPVSGYFTYNSGTSTIDAFSADSTTMIVQGLSSQTFYEGYIVLSNGSVNSSQSSTFSFSTSGPPPPTPPAPVFQNYSNIQETSVDVIYNTYSGFGGNTPTSGTFSAFNTNTQSNIFLTGLSANSTTLTVTGLDSATFYTGCTFTISDGSQTSDPGSAGDLTTASPPPTYASPVITNITYDGTNAIITYNPYSQESGSFGTPNGGTLYLNNGPTISATSANDTTMVVDIVSAAESTIFTNCYITLTDSSVTSNASGSITVISAPGSASVTPYNLAADISYTSYSATISAVIITDTSDPNITYTSQNVVNGSFTMTGPTGGPAYLNPDTRYIVKFYVQTDVGNSAETTITFTTTNSFPALDIPIVPTQLYPYVTSNYDSMTPSVGVTFTFTSTYNAFYPFTPDGGTLRNDMGTIQGTLASVSTNSVTINNITPVNTTFTGYTLNINYGPYASFYSSGTAFLFTTYPAPTMVQQINDPVNPTPPNQVDISFLYPDTGASFSSVLLILNGGNYGTSSVNYGSGSGTFSISGIQSGSYDNCYIVLYLSGGYTLPSDVFPVTIT